MLTQTLILCNMHINAYVDSLVALVSRRKRNYEVFSHMLNAVIRSVRKKEKAFLVRYI